MSGYRLGHDLDDDPELYAGHVLDEVPLVFEDGEAIATADERQRCGRMRSGRPGGDQSRTTAVRRGPRNAGCGTWRRRSTRTTPCA